MRDKSILRMIHLGLSAALVFVATYFIKIVLPIGYIHIGDGMILASATLLGPVAWLPAALGSSLADLMLGFTPYALPTFLIKGLVGLVAGFLLTRVHKTWLVGGIFVAVELLMVGGYFVTESFMYGINGAIPAIPSNLIQGASGVIIGFIVYPYMVSLRRRVEV